MKKQTIFEQFTAQDGSGPKKQKASKPLPQDEADMEAKGAKANQSPSLAKKKKSKVKKNVDQSSNQNSKVFDNDGQMYSPDSPDRNSNAHILAKKKALQELEEENVNERMTEEQILKINRCWPTFLTIVTYLISEQKKKQRSFQIGVFTVFLVVSFLTLLKSAVDVAPVAFVKIGQDQSGSIDFRLMPSQEAAFMDGNHNFYTDYPSWYNDSSSANSPALQQQITEDEDSISVDGFKILKFDVFEKKLQSMPGFEGFSPRWTLITKLRNTTNALLNSSSLLLIIDSKREIDIGLGRYFSQTILGENDIFVSNTALRYLGISPQNKEQIELYFSYQMFCQILGVCGTDDDSNQNGAISKSTVYTALKMMGFNISSDSTITLNITDDLKQLQNLYGDQNLTLTDSEIDSLLPNFNLNYFNITTQDMEGRTINLDPFGISGIDLNVEGDNVLDQLNLENATISGGNVTVSPSQLINGRVNLTVSQIVDFLLTQRNLTTVQIKLDPLIDQVLAQGLIPQNLSLNYQVVEGFDSPNGKFSNTLGNVALIDCHSVGYKMKQQFLDLLDVFQKQNPLIYAYLTQANPDIETIFPDNFDLCPYALQIEGILTKGVQYYILDDREMENELARKGTDIVNRISLQTNASLTTPLMTQVEQIGMVRIFLSSSMGTVVFFLGILSVVLIYSLMLSDVDEKTYSYGMLRALGFRNKNLVGLISLQSFSFSIPGLLGGLLVAYFLNLIVRYMIFVFAQNTTDYSLSAGSIALGCVLGIVLPIIANIIPIQKALSKNLRASLDLYHRSVNELTVSIKRLEEMGLSINQLIVSLMLVSLGILTYYVAPMAFIYRNYSLFFFILNFILILMILGLAFVSILLLPYIQLFFVKTFILVMRKDKNLYQVVRKNLDGHEARNTKTAMMFTIALSFLIFSGSTFELIGHMIISQLESTVGSDLYATSIASKVNFIDEGPLIQFLEEQKLKDGAVEDYSFATTEMNEFIRKIAPNSNAVKRMYIGSACGYNQVRTKVFGLQKNYLQVVNTDYYMPRETQSGITYSKLPNGDYDSVESLYSDEGLDYNDGTKDPFNITVGKSQEELKQDNFTDQIKILAPEGFRNVLSLDTETQARLCMRQQYEQNDICSTVFRGKIRAMITKIPGFLFMSYRQIAFFGSILISNDQYSSILQSLFTSDQEMKKNYENIIQDYNFTDGLPKEYLFVKLTPGIADYRREYIANGVRSFFRDDTTILLDRKSLLDSINSSLLLFQVFVIIVGTIALTLSFFLLLISTTSNIKENLWEFGVIRAIGLTKEQTKRVFMYEAFAVIFGALTLGIIVGLTVAITLTAQFYLFIELPFKLSFPTYLFVAMIVMSLVTTYFAVLIPVRDVNNRRIAVVLKGSG